jgi:hypothetical protein
MIMSIQGVEKIIRKAVVDAEFREKLFTNSEKVFDEFDLTGQERAAFADLSEEGLARGLAVFESGELDERISRGGWQ